MLDTFRSDSAVWAILGAMDGSLIGFLVVLAFPPRSWRAELEFGHDRVRLIPRPVLRWIDEPSVEMELGLHTQEILLCHGNRNNSPYGFRVILRAAGVPDREIKAETGDILNLRESKVLTDGIFAATGLPVRLIEYRAGKDGKVREGPWTPAGKPVKWAAFAKATAVALPFVSGIVVGHLRPSVAAIVITEIALWSIQETGVLLFDHFTHRRRNFAASKLFSSFFNFAIEYAIAFAFVKYLMHKG